MGRTLQFEELVANSLEAVRCDLNADGDHVFLAELSAAERDELETIWDELELKEKKQVGFRTLAVTYCLCDKDRKRDFGDRSEEVLVAKAKVLASKKARLMQKLFKTASRINGFTVGDIAELEKNLVSQPRTSDAGSGE